MSWNWTTNQKRIINWTIIKQVWIKYRKAGDFDKAFGINHNYYYEIINGQMKEPSTLKKISQKTNINIDILTGKILLGLNEEIKPYEWQGYINLITSRTPDIDKDEKKALNDSIAKFRTKVTDAINNQTNIEQSNKDLYAIDYYARNMIPYKNSLINVMNGLIYNMNLLDWNQLEKVYDDTNYKEHELFEKYYIQIEKQHKLLDALLIYKKCK